MKRNVFFSYRLFIWLLLLIAMIMGGGYLIIAYSYNLQKETEIRIDHAQQSVNVAKELEIELVRLRGFTFTYLVDKSKQWQDSIKASEIRFIIYLERARLNARTTEETSIIQQISALFANYEQSIIMASLHVRQNQITKANALIVHAARDLLETIHEKSRLFIELNQKAEVSYELGINTTNAMILRVMFFMGLGGIMAGLFLGWIISRMIFSPIRQIILQVRGASGGALLEEIELPRHGDLEELGDRIKELINRINEAQQALDKNKQLLQYSNKYAVLGKVAPTVAHEIRNPLAAIKMLIYSMKDELNHSPSTNQDLEIITSEIDRMDEFIRNFLKFARPADPVFADINPVDVLHEVIQLLKPRIKKNDIQLIESSHNLKIKSWADSGHLKQLFMNLLINAIDVMPNGGQLNLTYSLPEKKDLPDIEPTSEYIMISIEDTGPGIPEVILNNLFEPFMKGTEQGVGLGLSISQNIASLHKGWIEGHNKPDNSGAVFSVFLPLYHL